MADVSQSLIAKIENNSIDPSFTKVKRIFRAFDEYIRKKNREERTFEKNLTVYDLATRGVISTSPERVLEEVVEEIMRGKFTQVPVIDGGRVVGSVTDDGIRKYIIEQTSEGSKTRQEVMKTPVKHMMDPPFPILSRDTPIEMASMHLQREEAVLVSSKGEIVAILTSSDFLNLVLV